MQHLMIDLETLGTSSRAAIIAIGACYFTPETGEIGDCFHRGVDWQSAIDFGKVSGESLMWWLDQSDEARKRVLDLPKEPLPDVLNHFKNFIWNDPFVWGNGATFDITILENAYGQNRPWSFRNVRDVRTIVHLTEGKVDKDSVIFEGTQHDALCDAIHQAKFVSLMWQALRN